MPQNDRELTATPAKRPCANDAKVKRLVWIDCEMTGLYPEKDCLLEIACLVTEGDEQLTIVAEGPNVVINQPDSVLENMVEFCKVIHKESGLIDEVKQSATTTEEAERQVLDFLKLHVPEGVCPLVGNTIGRDRQFLEKYMPNLAAWIHYRNVDVSSFREMAKRLWPDLYKRAPKKEGDHRAMIDIKESRLELLHYVNAMQVRENETGQE